jgi:hypothetical protein
LSNSGLLEREGISFQFNSDISRALLVLLKVLKITAKILQVESLERFHRVKGRVRILSLDVEIIFRINQSSSDDFHQQRGVRRAKKNIFVEFFVQTCKLAHIYFVSSRSVVGGAGLLCNDTSLTFSL